LSSNDFATQRHGTQMTAQPFVPPPYPYDRLDALAKIAAKHDGGVIDLSIGTPCDPPTAAVVAALSSSNSERGYPASIGSEPLRKAAHDWMQRRFVIDVPLGQIAACVGSKEFVATTPQYMKLRRPDRDTVLFPAVAYPTYEMGATLAGCRAVAVPMNASGGLDLASISASDAARALMLWVNSPSNPTGALDDLAAAATWGRAHGVPVFSDECYVEFTWSRKGESILQHGLDGVVALHSLSKRSNLAGVRVAFYAGDSDIVNYLKEVRKHVGMMVPGPAQAAGVVALNDDAHVATQRDVYARRLARTADVLSKWSGISITMPEGGFYLWFDARDGWEFAERLARDGGALVSPGDFYGAGGANNVRVAVVQPDAKIELLAKRLGA
jgi:succinyldiaminopimelate transaminase